MFSKKSKEQITIPENLQEIRIDSTDILDLAFLSDFHQLKMSFYRTHFIPAEINLNLSNYDRVFVQKIKSSCIHDL